MKPNFELLNRVLDHIRMNPRDHDQDVFRHVGPCGTQMCMAGWACELTGGRWLDDTNLLFVEPDDYLDDVYPLSFFARSRYAHLLRDDAPPKLPLVTARARAQRLLNLDFETAQKLFYRCNDLDDLERVVKDLENEWVSDR